MRHRPTSAGNNLQAMAKDKIGALIEEGRWRPGERMPTVRELAEDLGMSRSIVARAIGELSDQGRVVTRRRAGTFVTGGVTPAAKCTKRGYCMVVTRDSTCNPSWRENVRQGLEDATGANVIFLLNAPLGCDEAHLAGLLDRLRPDTRYGFVLASVPVQVKAFFQRRRAAAVILGGREPGIALPSINVDEAQIVRDTMALLRNAGYARIAFVTRLPYRGGDYVRAEAFEKAVLADGGLGKGSEDEKLLVAEQEDEVTMKRALKQLLTGSMPPTGFLAAGTSHAIWICQVAGELGLRVPEDIAVVCLGDSPLCVHHRPAITAVSIQEYQWGHLAGRLLARMLGGEFIVSDEIMMPFEISERETTGDVDKGEFVGDKTASIVAG